MFSEQCLMKRRYEEAAEGFGMAAHLDPDEGEYLAHLGYALYLSKPGDSVIQREAMEHVAAGVKRSPERPLSYIYLGRILRGQGDTDAARRVFQRALRIRQLIRAHEIRGGGPVRFFHRDIDGQRVRELRIGAGVARSLERGRAAIAAENMGNRIRYVVVSEIGAEVSGRLAQVF